MALVKLKEVGPPTGWKLMVYRAPILLYRIGLSGLLGKRFLMLNHVGRKSGEMHQTVLEVVRHDLLTNEFVIASGFGQQSQWFKNLMQKPDVIIQVGWERIEVLATLIEPAKAESEMVDYGHRHPKSAKMVAGLMGYEHEGSEGDLRELSKIVPLIRLASTRERELFPVNGSAVGSKHE